MNTHIKVTAMSLTPNISDYINKRLEKISNLLSDDPTVQCDIEIGRTTAHHNKGAIFHAEIHIVGKHSNVFSTANKEDLELAIEEVCDDAFRSLTSKKKKYISMVKKGGTRVKAMVKGLWPF